MQGSSQLCVFIPECFHFQEQRRHFLLRLSAFAFLYFQFEKMQFFPCLLLTEFLLSQFLDVVVAFGHAFLELVIKILADLIEFIAFLHYVFPSAVFFY